EVLPPMPLDSPVSPTPTTPLAPADESLERSSEHAQTAPLAHAGMLEDHLPERWRVTAAVPVLVGVLGVAYILLSYLPLWHTDLWGHLAYGQWIAQHGRVPITEPLMPLS